MKKNEIIFYLEKRRDKQTGEMIVENVPLFLLYSLNGEKLQFYTGIRVAKAEHFNGTEVKGGAKERAREINKEIGRLRVRANEIIDKAHVNGEELTIEIFRDKLRGGEPVTSKADFNSAFKEYLASCVNSKTAETIANIGYAFNIIREFCKKHRIRLDFSNITMDFYNRFLPFCFDEKDFYNNYTGSIIRDLKAFLAWATEKGYNKNLDFKKKGFKKLTEEPEIVFLTWEELMKLYSFKFKRGQELLGQVRDLFCLGCFTGMRFSDIQQLGKPNIFKGFIQFKIKKQTDNNTVPLNPYSSDILDRYFGKNSAKQLPQIQRQLANDTLKEVFKAVKLNRIIQQTRYKGTRAIVTVLPLSEVITFHVSKKTFMTNFIAKGGSLLTAMSITGNKTYKSAQRYFKVVDNLKAIEMQKVFGTGKLKKAS